MRAFCLTVWKGPMAIHQRIRRPSNRLGEGSRVNLSPVRRGFVRSRGTRLTHRAMSCCWAKHPGQTQAGEEIDNGAMPLVPLC